MSSEADFAKARRSVVAKRKPTITAHAGSLDTVPNSPHSFEVALALPIDYLEADVRFTPEGVAYLNHDALSPEEIARAMSLEALLEMVSRRQGLCLNLDLKEFTGVAKVRELVSRYGMDSRVVFTGVRLESVGALRAGAGGLPYFLNAAPSLFERMTRSGAERLADRVRDSGAVGLNTHKAFASRLVARALAKAALALSIWTIDEESEMRAVLALGPDNMTTRRPDRLIALRDVEKGE